LNKLRAGISKVREIEQGRAGREDEAGPGGIREIVRGAMGVVKDYLLGPTSVSANENDHSEIEAQIKEIMLELEEHTLNPAVLLNRLDLVEAHLERLHDHAAVVCAEGVKKIVKVEGEGEEIQVEHGPVEAVLTLLTHFSDRQGSSFTEQAMRRPITLEEEESPAFFAPIPNGQSAPGFIVKGLPSADEGGVASPPSVRLGYHQNSEGGLELVWRCVVEMKENWYEASVGINNLKVLAVVDWGEFSFPSEDNQRWMSS
jgi:hypothetical protein